MNDETKTPRTDEKTCVRYGPTLLGDHTDCPVRFREVVCACECTQCKRAWFAAGRPKTGFCPKPWSFDGRLVRDANGEPVGFMSTAAVALAVVEVMNR